MRNKFAKILLTLLGITSLIGLGFGVWVSQNEVADSASVSANIPTWYFSWPDAAKISNVYGTSYLTATQETELFSPAGSDGDAVRLTNTGGSQSRTHYVNIHFNEELTLGDIYNQKVVFDYYYAQKREQAGRGIPKLQLLYNTSTRGSDQGGVDLPTNISPFIVDDIGSGWWHLEFFITALAPIITDHGDSPVNPKYKINGVRITDGTIFDYHGNIAFAVVDNLRLDARPASRLGIFNRQSSYAHGKYYWVKVCWSGELGDVNMTFSDDSLAEYTPSNKSPFYIYLKAVGVVDIHITLVAGGTPLAIDWTLTIT